jgi:hypothetical protein
MRLILVLALVILTADGFAQTTPEKEGPCRQIKEACQRAGFVQGEAKEGYGLWVDCIDPLMRGTAQPSKAKRPLPTVGADLINACKARHPNFGEGHSAKKK